MPKAKKPLAIPRREQPIPPEKLKDFYIIQLELQGAQDQLQARLRHANEDFTKLFAAHGVKPEDWKIDLRNGIMIREDKAKAKAKDPAYRGPRSADSDSPPEQPSTN